MKGSFNLRIAMVYPDALSADHHLKKRKINMVTNIQPLLLGVIYNDELSYCLTN
jgi:hypothetical protein